MCRIHQVVRRHLRRRSVFESNLIILNPNLNLKLRIIFVKQLYSSRN